ncbi:MAG: SDR family NAD(P)-dependent oxidoreductase [Candidatus Heimdallarchaeaceae archaeon]
MKTPRLMGRVAIVTGAGRGIGRAISLELAKEGAKIVAVSKTIREVRETVKQVKCSGSDGIALKVDVTSPKDVKNMVKKTVQKFKRIDILVNNAGVAIYKPLIHTTEKEWNEIIKTNLEGIFLCSREVLPVMIAQCSEENTDEIAGVIINISSQAGKHGFSGLSAYSASKFGVIGLTESLAEEVADYNIRVYALCPRGVDTNLYRSLFPHADTSRLLKPRDVAKKVVELCLPNCPIESGSVVDVL